MLPGNKATWDIPRFFIVDRGADSGSDSEHSSISDAEELPVTDSPELSDISKLLLRAKAAAEVGGRVLVGGVTTTCTYTCMFGGQTLILQKLASFHMLFLI